MSTVAEQLRQAREAKPLTIPQAAEITKIRSDHLRALEAGDFDAFSAPVYIRGFVRSYATLLKLNVPQLMSVLDDELRQTKKFAEPPPLMDSSGGVVDTVMLFFSKVDWRKSLAALAVVTVLGGLALGFWSWRHYRRSDPLAGLKPGLYQSKSNVLGETLPLPAPTPGPAPGAKR